MNALAPTLAMAAAFALVVGGVLLLRQPAARVKGILMLVMAIILIANVAIWTA